MKVCKVQIYDIDRSIKNRRLYKIDRAVVKKIASGVVEIVSNEKVALLPNSDKLTLKHLKEYKNDGYILALRRDDLKKYARKPLEETSLKNYLYLYKHLEISRIIERKRLANYANVEKAKNKEKRKIDKGLKKAKKLSKKLCY